MSSEESHYFSTTLHSISSTAKKGNRIAQELQHRLHARTVRPISQAHEPSPHFRPRTRPRQEIRYSQLTTAYSPVQSPPHVRSISSANAPARSLHPSRLMCICLFDVRSVRHASIFNRQRQASYPGKRQRKNRNRSPETEFRLASEQAVQ